MATDRLEALKKFYREHPEDPFNIYSLALEFLKHDIHESRRLFEVLLREHDNYIPTYYQAGKMWLDWGDREGAMRIYEKGIALCRSQGETKALRELQSAYNEMMFD